jgi:hypothetical protein
MKRLACTLAAACLAAAALAAPAAAHYPAQGNFGLNGFDVTFDSDANGTPATEAGSHPFAITTKLQTNLDGKGLPEGRVRDFLFEQAPGLIGDSTAYPRCSTLDFLEVKEGINNCPLDTALGISATAISIPGSWFSAPVFNLQPPPGVVTRLGFRALVENVVIDARVNPNPPYNLLAELHNIPQLADFFANKTQLWGDPSDPRHDELRGTCGSRTVNGLTPGDIEAFQFESKDKGCHRNIAPRQKPFLTLPTTCAEPLLSSYEAFSWEGDTDFGAIFSHDAAGNPVSFAECGKLGFGASISARPTNRAASSPTGLDFSLDVEDEGLLSVDGHAKSAIRKIVTELPKGMTANPSLAEGLEVCSEADLGRERVDSAPGQGCPEASKIGTLEVESPLVEEPVTGTLYQATPHANLAGDSLIAFYVVFKNAKLGIIVKQPVKVEPDPATGQLRAIAEEVPQLPFSHFRLHFREGGRSPLVSPPLCGSYQVKAQLTPWSGTAPIEETSSFDIVSGPNEGPCPAGGTPPFKPGFQAGSDNNAAGRFSPFSMRLTRRDGDQDLTRFDATLPRGVGGILAGIDKCPEAQISLAKNKSGVAELASPSCPLNSRLGGVFAGAGVGSQLTYVRGSVYLAGPFAGAPISAVAITPAVAGPFDVGTVVYRQALQVDPRTGEVTADGAHSDPLPHILAGIPLVVRDVQVHIDRSGFTYNPTNCDPFATKASIWGGGANAFSLTDDSPVARAARFQAADCQSLGFNPSLSLRLKGGTRRGDFPSFHLSYKPRKGDANLSRFALRFPHSEFIEQGHFRTICTRVQFAAGAGAGSQCPKESVYGHVRVFTPVLSEPLQGPVFLRSSSHNLPDVVLALHGPPSLPVDFEVDTRIDSIHGGLRAIAEESPDVPISKVLLDMQGGQKGLFVNSTNLCLAKHHAAVSLDAQNGKQLNRKPLLKSSCSKQG